MGSGDYNGKNYGGGHTGRGDFKKGGPYSNGGRRWDRKSHREFKVGLRVSYIDNKRTPKMIYYGVVVERESGNKYENSLIPVKYDGFNKIYYVHNRLLTLCKKDNMDIIYSIGDKVRFTRKGHKLYGFTGKIVDKPEAKANYLSFVQVKLTDKNGIRCSCYVHKNLIDKCVDK